MTAVRVLLVQPAYTNTPFDAKLVRTGAPSPAYAERVRVFDEVLAATIRRGDNPGVVAKVILRAATDPRPKLRFTAGPTAGPVSTLRRLVPAHLFDSQIRKLNRLAG